MSLAIVFAIIALILAAIDLVRSRGQALTSWAVVLLALIFILPLLK